MLNPGDLLLHCFDKCRVGVASYCCPGARQEINENVAIDIRNGCTLAVIRNDRQELDA